MACGLFHETEGHFEHWCEECEYDLKECKQICRRKNQCHWKPKTTTQGDKKMGQREIFAKNQKHYGLITAMLHEAGYTCGKAMSYEFPYIAISMDEKTYGGNGFPKWPTITLDELIEHLSEAKFIEVHLNDTYVAKVYKDKIIVDDEEFPISCIEALEKAYAKVK
jgi:hypothetical protein